MSDEGIADLPKVHSPVKLMSEFCLSGCSVTIIDSKSHIPLSIDNELEEELENADVILLVFDVSQPNSIGNLTDFWLANIQKYTKSPVLVIGNKLDLREKNLDYSLENTVKALSKSSYFDMVLECSALTLDNLSDVFLHAQKIVLYPVPPLYNITTENLTADFKRALSLIFKISDKDQDFLLNSQEILNMHLEAFEVYMENEDLEELKKVIKKCFPSGITHNALNFEGFCYLQIMMIEKLQSNICWDLLTHYKFDRNLSLKFSYSFSENLRLELTPQAISFLLRIFDQYSDQDFLNVKSLEKIFQAAKCSPWGQHKWPDIEKIVVYSSLGLSCNSWLALWHLLAFQDPEQCFLHLLLIGFGLPCEQGLSEKLRNTICGYLIGFNGVGKTWILNSLIQRQCDEVPTSSVKSACAVLSDSPVPWEKKFLILIEYPVIEFEEMMRKIKFCDCAVIVTDETKASARFTNEVKITNDIKKVRAKNDYRSLCIEEILNEIARPSPQHCIETSEKSNKSAKIFCCTLLFTLVISYFLHIFLNTI